MKFGVVIFPGTNCDVDTFHGLGQVMGQEVRYLWHKDKELYGCDCLILPGGFSHGDYLRAGAIARFSPIMESVAGFAEGGGLVLGICNGFQILCEAGLLPGALLRNDHLQFRCQWVGLRLENANTLFTLAGRPGQVLRMPIAHGEGRYYADEATLRGLETGGQVVLRYCDAQGRVVTQANPNGSLGNIAGIVSRKGNVMGLMPHPERASEVLLGGEDGRVIWESLLQKVTV